MSSAEWDHYTMHTSNLDLHGWFRSYETWCSVWASLLSPVYWFFHPGYSPNYFFVQIWMNLFPFSCVFWIRNHQVHNCASTLMGKNWKVHTVHRGRFNESTSYQHWWWWSCPDSNPWTMCVSWYTCKLIAPRLSCGVAIQQMGSHN